MLQSRASLTDARGFRAEMSYDGHGRQKRWIFPSKTIPGVAAASDYEEYGYDANGNRLSLRKRDGSVLTYQYDALNRLVWKVVPERAGLTAAQTRDVAYEYDLRGLQTQANFDNMEGPGLHNVYDGFGRLVKARVRLDGVMRDIDIAYDADGNRVRITHPDGVQFNFSWDGMDRLRAVNDNGSYQSIDDSIVSKVYDPQGTNGLLLWGNGNAMFAHARFFDGIGRQTYLGYDLPGTANDLSYALGYNPASQVTSQVRSNPAFAWTGSVPVNRNYAVNGQNQYETAGPASFAYDANGNLTSDGSTTYVYDVENRLVSATGATNASLVYDPLGRLWETSGGSAGVTRFLYDGDELAAEYDGSGTLLRRYVHGNLADDPLAVYEGASLGPANRAYLETDTQGSVVALINGNGTLRSRNTYDEYGIPGAANAGRFQYTGQAWIPELGMYYYKARIYSPTLGRFMQTDPVGYEDQVNLYAYVGDDPVNEVDPDGTETGNIGQRSTEQLSEAAQEHPPTREDLDRFKIFPYVAPVIRALETIADIVHGDAPPEPEVGTTGGRGVQGTGRMRNALKPDPRATGPHSTFKRGKDGNVSGYATYRPNSRNPSGHQETKRVDVTGRPHTNPDGRKVSTPHVKEEGSRYVRPATPAELPKKKKP